MKILLVDDTAMMLAMFAIYLSDLGHEITTAKNGTEAALQWEQNGPFDAVVTDVRMPWADGIFLLQYFAGMKEPPRCYVHSTDDYYDWKGGQLDLKAIGNLFPFAEFHEKINFTGEVDIFLASVAA